MNSKTFILFGATGDLAQRKLIPALYQLVARGILQNFLLIGAAYEAVTSAQMLEKARPFITNFDQSVWENLQKNTFYQRIDFNSLSDFYLLSERITELEKAYTMQGNRLIYLATAAYFFADITKKISIAEIAHRTHLQTPYWHRIVYEKPFGHDLQSARDINTCIAEYYEEHQIYRIDHYLTKELVNNIALMRFANTVFEPLWNKTYIDEVQIILAEPEGIDGRGAYYDKYGALRDVVQNHMLELLAIVAMESPVQLVGDHVRDRRAQVLQDVTVADGLFGQYNGYRNELHVNNQSTTDTFALVQCYVNNDRWQGVPFYLKTGKHLARKETVIHIQFKSPPCILTHSCPLPPNWLTINIAPEATFTVTLNTKQPGKSDGLVSVPMEFCHSCIFGNCSPEAAYETLLEEIMRGEQSVSVRFDEIEYAWRIIDSAKAMEWPLYAYQPGTAGPIEVEEFENNHHMKWKS